MSDIQQVHTPISVFDMFKIGVGPSSSHTLGPWKAALALIAEFESSKSLEEITQIQICLYGSLAKTGKGHGTDIAVQMGLLGADPETCDVTQIGNQISTLKEQKKIHLGGKSEIDFDPENDIVFLLKESLPYHPNALTFMVTQKNGLQSAYTYYSVGGGFIQQEGRDDTINHQQIQLPFPIQTANDLLHWCRTTGLNIHEVVLENEMSWRSAEKTEKGVLRIWQVMKDCIYAGCTTQGELPGGLQVRRRTFELSQQLLHGKTHHSFESWIKHISEGGTSFPYILDWVSCFALAVNEQNAAFGRVVTAPTNGAAGVIPAVLMYHVVFCKKNSEEDVIKFLLTASEIGSIFKKGATISAAMGGCQAEIGVSSAMAAAALTACMGGTQRQVLMAAEIAMEHHLGLTCDPIKGLVQIPCIERNAMGAIKAITASQLALQSKPDFAKVSLDDVVNTMWQTALDMNHKYKETAEGGLSVNVPISLSEC